MSFTLLLILISILSAILTFIIKRFAALSKSILMSFLQFFFGLLFVISGFVKAVDPIGFSYKMEEYFQEFQNLFEPTWLAFLNPLLLFYEHNALYVGIIMIVIEMVIGVMLIIGFKPKLTAWSFFLLMFFFTVLTGYTYLTAYVPKESNFFEFSKWVAFDKNNMRVTDCGCFGDFIKFSAWHTFLKDLIMLIPGLFFILRAKNIHQIFTSKARLIIVTLSIIVFYIFNLYNFKWSEPVIDFREFKEGVNIRERKELELNSSANVKEKAVIIQNKVTKEILELPSEQYNATLDQFPREKYSVLDRIYEEPEIPTTGITYFLLEDLDGYDVTDQILSDKKYSFMIVSPNMIGDPQPASFKIQDTIFRYDTIKTINTDNYKVVKTIVKIEEKQVDDYDYIWDECYMQNIKKYITPLVENAKKDGFNSFFSASTSASIVKDFVKDGGPDIVYYNSDDTTLKTILRSNPGVLLLKDGTIIKKWHYRKLPEYEVIKRKYMK
jgi:uncharacterized membrane protein YphA (DoxX/SURF4 family)